MNKEICKSLANRKILMHNETSIKSRRDEEDYYGNQRTYKTVMPDREPGGPFRVPGYAQLQL